MAILQITCLGDCQIALDGTAPSTTLTDKARALLIYLALEPQVHQRVRLTQIFWSGYGEESARNSLRQALYALRQFLPETGAIPWLLVTRQTVQRNPAAPISIDATTFTQLLAAVATHPHGDLATCTPCLTRLRQAVDLYRGDFLAALGAIDSDGFEEWRRITQEQLHIQMLDALALLVTAAERVGDTDGALQATQRQLTLEPWLESAHRQIMRLLAQRGQRAAAEAQYQRCRQVLAEELGVTPDAETTALYEQIKRQREARPAGTRETREARQETRDRRQGDTRQGEMREADSSDLVSRVSLSAAPPHNLPDVLSPLIGRAQALTEIAARLQTLGTRLLTLVGPGGMGKTSLALTVGRAQLPLLADGVWFVPLAAINHDAALVPAIANALGVPLQGGDPRTTLLQTLRPKQLLLLLDNFEQLLTAGSTAVDLVVDLLETAPQLQIIITSRERLKLRSEQVYRVQPLPFAERATLDEAAALPAVRLFVQATQRSHADFQLTAGNLAAVLRICRLVQGMPLGLELAAANAGGAPLHAIAEAIEQSAEFLAVEWRDVPARQRSMRAVFAWSWQLLSPLEQRILRQSALFLGGFAYDAAQAVLNATLVDLSRLVDKSLLQWQTTASGEGRYLMHELLRQFAAEELQQLPTEAASVAANHSAYYLEFVAACESRLTRQEARLAADEIELEINNVRQAWQWAATNQAAGSGQAVEGLGRAAYSLWNFYSQRANRAEAEQMFRFALQQAVPTLTAADAPAFNPRRQAVSKLLALHAELLVAQGKQSEAATAARQAIVLSQSCGDLGSEVMGSLALGMALLYQNQAAEAQLLFVETVALAQRYHSQFAISEGVVDAEIIAREYLAGITFDAGDYPGSRAYLHPTLRLSQTLDRPLGEQRCYYVLARLAYFYGDYRAAQQEYEQTLALARRFGDRMYEANALIGLGGALRWQGAYGRAEEVLGQGLALARIRDDVYSQVWALVEFTRLHCLLGHLANADLWVTQLSQLMATRELFPESREAILLVLALHAQATGHAEQALAYAQKAKQLNTQAVGYGLAYCLITLGGVHAHQQRWAAAAAAYQAAITCCQQLNNRLLGVEAQAGLAQAVGQQGNLAGALAQVEALLPALADEPRAGFNSPFLAYWAGYQVLAANNDPRAASFLQQGYDLLQQDAAALDAKSRHSFLTAVPLHRDLVAAYRTLPARAD